MNTTRALFAIAFLLLVMRAAWWLAGWTHAHPPMPTPTEVRVADYLPDGLSPVYESRLAPPDPLIDKAVFWDVALTPARLSAHVPAYTGEFLRCPADSAISVKASCDVDIQFLEER